MIEKKKNLFSLASGLLCTPFITSQSLYDTVKFQIDLEILASSKNFDKRLHNFKCFFFFSYFSRDFVLAFSRLFLSIGI